MRPSSVLLLVLSSRSCTTQQVNAMAIAKPSRSSVCTRRNFLPAGVVAVGSSFFLVDGPREARAAEDQAALRPQPIPMPIAGVGGARLSPVVIERNGEDPWKIPPLSTKLGLERIGAQELSPLTASLSPFGDRDLYYPPSFVGEWNVKTTLRRKSYPYGLSFVPSTSLVEGSPRYRGESVEDSTSYQIRYYPLENENKIIADRRFNSVSVSRAYDQLTPVDDVVWDPRKDPTVLKIQFAAGGLTRDMRPIGPRRAEVYITARKKEDGVAGVFATSERIRQVTLGAGSVDVFDTETITEYEVINDGNNIRAVQRIAVYLTPNPNSKEGVLWQQVGGKAVAFFDYFIEMQKA